jgi:hypothetical protein
MSKPKRFQLDPAAVELAKIAAALLPHSSPRSVELIRKARELYIEALISCRECATLSPEELVSKFRNRDQAAVERWGKARAALWKDSLELNPEKESDPARDHLAEHNLHLKTPGKVLEHTRAAWDARPPDMMPSSFDIVEHCKRSVDGKEVYFIPRFLLDWAVRISEHNRRKAVQKSRARSRQQKTVK